MQSLQYLVPIDALAGFRQVILYAILALVLANMVTRLLAYRTYERQYDDDVEEFARYTPHQITTALLLATSFLFLVIAPHGGMVLSVLVLGLFLADFFEFEARLVEARNGMKFEKPKAALTASIFVLLYAAYQALFFLVEPFWSAVV